MKKELTVLIYCKIRVQQVAIMTNTKNIMEKTVTLVQVGVLQMTKMLGLTRNIEILKHIKI